MNKIYIKKRSFYLQLFRIYSELPFEECLGKYAKYYNELFIKEKPLTVQKYFLCALLVVEGNQLI